MNRTELTDRIIAEAEPAGFEAVATGGERRNPVFWRDKSGAIECVFSIQSRDIAKDLSHLEAVVKRFKGFADTKRRVIVLHDHHYDGTEKPDGTRAVIDWVKANVKGSENRIEVWNEMTRIA